MQKTIRKYFTCANSSQGFINFFASTLNQMEKIYILKGGPGTGKSTLMKKIGARFHALGETVEYIYCSSDTSSLDGVVLCDRKTIVADGTAPHVIEAKAPGALEEYVNLGTAWDSERLRLQKEEILSIKQQISNCYDTVYDLMRRSKAVHDEWEQIYITNTDYKKLDELTQEFCEKILPESASSPIPGTAVHRFFGASAPEGSINYIENLTEGLQKRYFIKGRPGTGKSTLLKKLAKQAADAGLDTEIYHCSFDPDSLDMVILRDLGTAVFDSTAPHELFPSKTSDEVLDLYCAAVKPNTDETYAKEITSLENRSNELNQEARNTLGTIHKLHDDLEAIYIKAMDFTVIDEITAGLIETIQRQKK